MHSVKTHIVLFFLSLFLLTACAGSNTQSTTAATAAATTAAAIASEGVLETLAESTTVTSESEPLPSTDIVDWSGYFSGLTGSAVIYIPSQNQYTIYNEALSNVKRSPCSTFKIISSLVGLEHGVIDAENSVRPWSGEVFWNEKWNCDIGFFDAFRASCIWYFREVINELGPEVMQMELDKLKYGNCDISDWEGRLNNNNNNRALTGFWVESSLKISPLEQTEVMERIFNANSGYSKKTLEMLKESMLVTDLNTWDIKVYGKTGLGKTSGVTVDAWFTGFAETAEETIYFCVYLGETEGMEVTSSQAKKIAVEILGDFYARKSE